MGEYNKDNKKSKLPTSIRFNEAQLKIAMSKSGKQGRQQLIDFLIDRYVNGENPIVERAEPIIRQSIAAYVGIQEQIAKQEVQQPIDKEGMYRQVISETDTLDGFKKVYKAIEQEPIHFKTKARLYEYLDKVKTEKGFIYND